jgi:hypothetical protein
MHDELEGEGRRWIGVVCEEVEPSWPRHSRPH